MDDEDFNDDYADGYTNGAPPPLAGGVDHFDDVGGGGGGHFDDGGGGGGGDGGHFDGGGGGGGGGGHFDDEFADVDGAGDGLFEGLAAPSAANDHDFQGDDVVYDHQGNVDQSHAEASVGSPGGLGMSSSGLPEEIDVNTHGLIEETTQRLTFVHGVIGVLIVDRDGLIVHSTMPIEEAARLAGPTLQLLQRARAVAAVMPDDELRMLCVRTRKYELLLCSEADGAFAICTIQDVSAMAETQRSSDEGEGGGISAAARSVLRATHTSVL